jgi:DNA damage-binding protein 1
MNLDSERKTKGEKEYIVAGTAYAFEGEEEPHQGRILVFEVVDKDDAAASGGPGSAQTKGMGSSGRRLMLVAEHKTRGAVYSLNAFNGKLLAGINSHVKLFSYVDKSPEMSELVEKAAHSDHILALYVQSRGDFIVVGDLMKSISLLVFREVDDTIEEIARDYNANWMTGVGIIDDDTYLGSETNHNLFTVQKNSEASTEETRHMLKVTGEYHLGEFVNVFKHGSLVMQGSTAQESAADLSKGRGAAPVGGAGDVLSEAVQKLMADIPRPQMLFGTINGVIGVIAHLNEKQYKFLKRLERALAEVIKGVGGLDHSDWRAFKTDRKNSPSKGFVDGDLIESFLEIGRAHV